MTAEHIHIMTTENINLMEKYTENSDNNLRRHTIKIALIAMIAAMLTGGKLALFLPNVEIVTLIIILTSCVFGITVSLPATLIFVTVEPFFHEVSTWLLSYYIYWPLLALVFSIFMKNKENPLFPTILAAIMTFLFGVITTLIDTIFAGGLNNGMFFRLFGFIYARGVGFCLTHILSNLIIVAILYKPLYILLKRLKERMY